VSNGSVFVVGNGSSAAAFSAGASNHWFANGLMLNTNSTLNGAGFSTLNLGGNLTFASNSTFVVDLSTNSATPGTGYDRVFVTGTVSLADSTLSINLTNFTATNGAMFTLINNDTNDSVFGTFAGLPQDAQFSSGGAMFMISYSGGTGNDVVLTVIPEASVLPLFVMGSIVALLRSRRKR
jgi:fibronectin-binding autotransporter adhesin